MLGTKYFKSMLDIFRGSALLAVAGYNAGPGAAKAGLTEQFVISDPDWYVENFPYRETRDYIRKVFSSYYLYRQIYQ
jgi:soluble lytic murein transglycosylase